MDYLSAPDVAARYGIPLRTVQAACSSGSLKAAKLGRMWLIDPQEACAYAERWQARSTQGAEVEFIDAQAHAWGEIRSMFDESKLFSTLPETANGPASTVDLTAPIRERLPNLLKEYEVSSMLDVACGDWNWMRLVELGDVRYTGWEVEPRLLDTARGYVNGQHKGAVEFSCANMVTALEVPYFDLIMCRDFLIHLPNWYIADVLNKFIASGSKYLLTSNYPDSNNDFTYDPDKFTWFGYMERPVNLEAEPFNLSPKLEAIPELQGPFGVIREHHELALFQLTD